MKNRIMIQEPSVEGNKLLINTLCRVNGRKRLRKSAFPLNIVEFMQVTIECCNRTVACKHITDSLGL